MSKQNSLSKRLLEHWQNFQCPDCRKGDRSKCKATPENAKVFREDETGKVHYYCFLGCLMLELDAESRRKLIESQFDSDGHYEMLRNSMYAAKA